MNVPEGTVTATNFSKTITGSGSNFDSDWEGKYIRIANNEEWYEIDEVASATSLTLKLNYRGPTASGQQYIIGADQQFKRQEIIDEPKTDPGAGKFSL